MKVLLLCLLLIDISASPRILDKVSATVGSKKDDTDTTFYDTVVSHLVQAFGTAKGSINLITK